MKRQLERARQETSGFKVYVLAGYYFLTGNYSLMVLVFGLVMIGLGATILSGQPAELFSVLESVPFVDPAYLQHDVFAGMFGVWGASFVVIGAVAYFVMWANRIYARVTEDVASGRDTDNEPEAETETL